MTRRIGRSLGRTTQATAARCRLSNRLESLATTAPNASEAAPQNRPVGNLDFDHVLSRDVACRMDRQALAHELVDDGQNLQSSTVFGAVHHEVVGPDLVALHRLTALRPVRRDSQASSFPALVRHSQVFSSLQPLCSPGAELPAGADQEAAHSAVAVARVFRGQRTHLGDKSLLVVARIPCPVSL